MQNEISISKKVKALRTANPKMTDEVACVLLGVTQEQLRNDRRKEADAAGKFFSDMFAFNSFMNQ